MNNPKSANKFMLFFLVYSLLLSLVLMIPLKYGFSEITILKLQYIPLIVLPILVYLILTKRNLKDLIPINKLSIKNCFYVIIITILIWPLLTLVSLISSLFVSSQANNDIAQYINNLSLFECVVFLAAAPAIFEESLCRGLFSSNYKTTTPIIMYSISGLFFGIIHMNFQQMSYAIVAGFVFAFLVHQTNSILSSMLSHFFINGYQVVLAKLLYSSDTFNRNEIANTNLSLTDNLMAITAVAVFAAILMPLLIKVIKKFKNYNNENAEIYLNNEAGTNKKFVDIYFILSIIIFIIYAILTEIIMKYNGTLG